MLNPKAYEEYLRGQYFSNLYTMEGYEAAIACFQHRMGTNHINSVMHVGDMPHWKAIKNMTLFADQVIPRLRPAGGVQ